jgi:predicted kinase
MDHLREQIETIQWELAKRVLTLGTSVTLENGFWSREERVRFRSEAETLGARVELHFLNVGLDELWDRLKKRNADLPQGSFHVGCDDLETWFRWFEPPSEDEMPFLTHAQERHIIQP